MSAAGHLPALARPPAPAPSLLRKAPIQKIESDDELWDDEALPVRGRTVPLNKVVRGPDAPPRPASHSTLRRLVRGAPSQVLLPGRIVSEDEVSDLSEDGDAEAAVAPVAADDGDDGAIPPIALAASGTAQAAIPARAADAPPMPPETEEPHIDEAVAGGAGDSDLKALKRELLEVETAVPMASHQRSWAQFRETWRFRVAQHETVEALAKMVEYLEQQGMAPLALGAEWREGRARWLTRLRRATDATQLRRALAPLARQLRRVPLAGDEGEPEHSGGGRRCGAARSGQLPRFPRLAWRCLLLPPKGRKPAAQRQHRK